VKARMEQTRTRVQDIVFIAAELEQQAVA
jgi:hypothetical protein